MLSLVRRYAATHGPFPTAQLANRYGVDPTSALRELESTGELVRGELLPQGTEREWCDADVLRRVRRASLAKLRKEVEAADRSELARFLPSWQNVDAHRPTGAGPDRLREALVPLQGVDADAEDLGARRSAAPPRHLLDRLARRALHQRRGGLDRRGQPGPERRQGRALLPRGRPPRRPARRATPSSRRRRATSTTRSAPRSAGARASGSTCCRSTATAEELHEALWDLAWNGEVTNDAFAPLRAPRLRAAGELEPRAGAASPSAAPQPPARCSAAGR